MRAGVIQTITDLMRQDKDVYFLTGDLGYNVLEKMEEEFPGRVVNGGVAEQNLMGVAAGFALSGKKVYVYSIIPFVTMRCYEQIRNDICYNDANVTILGIGSGLTYGILSATHFSLEDVAILRALPNMKIFSPADETEAILGIKELYKKGGPAYVRMGKSNEPTIYEKPFHFELGKGVVLREGPDVVFYSSGTIMTEVLKAADLLLAKGVKSTVVNLHTIKPIDRDIIIQEAIGKKHAYVIEEHGLMGGLGSAVAEVLAQNDDTPTLTLFGTPDKFIHDIGSQSHLRSVVGLSADKIVQRVLKSLA